MLMGNGIEFLREHIPSNGRIHYIITNGERAATSFRIQPSYTCMPATRRPRC